MSGLLGRNAVSAVASHPSGQLDLRSWQAEVVQLLEERHLSAWARTHSARMAFGLGLAGYLAAMPESEVCILRGGFIQDLESFCFQLERELPGPPMTRAIEGPAGVIARLRSQSEGHGPAAKRRYYIWLDADALLKADAGLMGRLADAMMGVAAEGEYVSDDRLLIQRVVFIGGPALDMYAEDASGQFCRWAGEGGECHSIGLAPWALLTGVARPQVMRYPIRLWQAGVVA